MKNAHVLAFDVVFAQLKQKLLEIPKLKVYIEPILHLVLLLLFFLPFPLYLIFIEVWERGASSPLESPQALMDDLPSFSLSPLTYITEVRAIAIAAAVRIYHSDDPDHLNLDWRSFTDTSRATGAIHFAR